MVMNACSETTLLLPLSLIRTRQVALDNVTPLRAVPPHTERCTDDDYQNLHEPADAFVWTR